MESARCAELIGVYDADGGLLGEAAYVIGKLFGNAHCSLCDITHSPIRRKPEWDQFAAGLGVTFTLLHRNETPEDVRTAVEKTGLPVVLSRAGDGSVRVLLGPGDLDRLDGSVAAFAQALDQVR